MSIRKTFWILTALTLVIYGESLFGGFVFDDRGINEHAPVLSSIAALPQAATLPYWELEAGLYRPVTLVSYALNNIFLGGSAMSFHAVNIALYIAVCFVLFLFIKHLFKNERLALVSALLFLVLPIHTEVVANITGRSELLALLFSLLTLYEFSKERVNFWLVGIYTFCAIGAKETAIAVLGIMPLVLLVREKRVSISLLKDYFRPLSAAVIGALLYLVARFFVLGPEHFLGVETSLIENPLLFAAGAERVATALSILWMYITKTFWPFGLCSDYSYNQIPVLRSFLHPTALLGALAYLGALFGTVFFLFRKPAVSFALGFFGISFLLVSNFIFPIGTIAGERLFFFPSVGVVLLAAWGLTRYGRELIIGGLIIFYATLAFNRQGVWLSEERLFLNAERCAPESVLSLSNAGAAYLFRGNLDKAAETLERSRAIMPIYSKGLNNLGLVYWKQGRPADAERLYFESLKQTYPYHGAIENMVLLRLSEQDEAGALRWLRIMYPNADDSALRSLF